MTRWVPPWTDGLLAVVLLVGVEVELGLVLEPGPSAVMAVAMGLGCLAVAYRRVAPLTATAIGITGLMVVPGLEGFDESSTFGWFVAGLVLAASCGFHADRTWVGLGLVLGLSAASIVVEKGPDVDDVLFAWIIVGGTWFASFMVRGQTAAARLAKEHAALVEERTAALADAAVAEERLRIAREMHDVVAHSLSVMMLHVGGVRRLLAPDQEAERAALADAERAGREATAEMHRILGLLREAPGTSPGPAPSLARLDEVLALARGAGLHVVLHESGAPSELPAGLELAAFRIVQEAVTNVLRHARATRVDVRLARRDDGLDLEVRDDGRGLGEGTPGHGLVGMRERAAAYAGEVSAGRHPDGGYVVRASLSAAGTPVAAGPA